MADFKKLAEDRQKQIETLEAELADFQEMSKQLEAEMVTLVVYFDLNPVRKTTNNQLIKQYDLGSKLRTS